MTPTGRFARLRTTPRSRPGPSGSGRSRRRAGRPRRYEAGRWLSFQLTVRAGQGVYDLAIDGRDLCETLGVPEGPLIGDILERLLADCGPTRIRLNSLEPLTVSDEIIELCATHPKFARHFHIPLQSGCDATLRRMSRRTDQRRFSKLLAAARSATRR